MKAHRPRQAVVPAEERRLPAALEAGAVKAGTPRQGVEWAEARRTLFREAEAAKAAAAATPGTPRWVALPEEALR